MFHGFGVMSRHGENFTFKVKKNKVFPMLNKTLFCEDMGEWRYSYTFLDLGNLFGQFHAVATLPSQGNHHWYPLDRLDGPQS